MSPKRYLVIEIFRADPGEIYRRLARRGRMFPEGLRYVDSWVTADLDRCYQIVECDREEALAEWMEAWSDLIDFEVVAVVSSGEARSRALNRLAED